MRLGHTPITKIRKMKELNCIKGLKDVKNSNEVIECETCPEGKMTKVTHKRKEKEKRQVLELVHSDLMGPISPSGYLGQKYIQILLDDVSGAIWVARNVVLQRQQPRQ